MGDDYFASPSGQSSGGQQPPQQPPAAAPVPPAGPLPGMPGYSGYQHEQVQSQVFADAPRGVPMSPATIVGVVACLGALLMMLGPLAPWVKVSAFGMSETVRGVHSDVNGRYVLAVGLLGLLAAGTAITSQANLQVRRICAGTLLGVGLIGLGIVVHEWTTVSDQFRKATEILTSFANSFSATSGTDPFAGTGFDGFHIAKGWGMWVSGLGCSAAAVAGAYLFLV